MATPAQPNKKPKLSLNTYQLSEPIAPGAKKIIEGLVAGRYLYITEASHPDFELFLNDSSKVKGRLARGWAFPEGEFVSKIEVRNLSGSQALTLRIELGNAAPIDNGLNVYTEQVTPTVREERPSSFSIVEVECTGIGDSLPLLPLDCSRHHALLFTSAGGEAYYGPDDTAAWPTVDGNRVGQTLDNSATRYQSCAACFVRGPVGTTVYAFVFGY